ncbi:DUF1573 domain-containing protein [Chryseolinea lacunae]|uniref:DUF1573 domain-containing protein n=1 Tax=Chryseolinea lacunae TaxID=2801331 RepID=A0ABS1L0S6_9BACT|nr:DUF1573 domain-containing protein [Chryseolinea lacunae]MBL0744532.1 DUF1573 domain-containing protein [Chryseolinea lacunae]
MRVSLSVFFLFAVVVSFGQMARPVQFREELFDFGSVKEEGGPVTHEFLFTNTTGRFIKILSVQASCGCTTPAWSKEPVGPGKTGFIQASYNPKGRPGYFNKSLTVTTDADSNPIILQIKGQVAVEGDGVNTDYQVSNGSWKLKSGSFNMGKVYVKDEFTIRDFVFVNGGTKDIAYSGKFVGPAYIKVDISPKVLHPGEKGNIKISYNGKMKGQYGFQSDNIELFTDDEQGSAKSFSVYATLEDQFPDLKPEELAKAPQLRLQATSLDFGRVQPNATTEREVQLFNAGKKELAIKSVQGNCSCISASAKKTTLKPGESSTIRIAFNPLERKGTQQKSVTVYSNDPQNPVQRITFSAYVED